ncbi:MAG: hypothetical protein AB7I32_15830, partial [Gammaproteobacteria bacterium]
SGAESGRGARHISFMIAGDAGFMTVGLTKEAQLELAVRAAMCSHLGTASSTSSPLPGIEDPTLGFLRQPKLRAGAVRFAALDP